MAAKNLKGITIEIGGNTSKLSDALKDVDSELSSLQSNLRTVESALRLDPGNVDALAERQRLLNDAVETTATRLDTLREAQRQVDQQIADGVDVDQRAYQNLRAEIIRAEASLNNYQSQASDAGDTSSDAADEAAEGWTIVGDIVADLASEAIQALIQAFGDLMLESEKAFDLLQARTGASQDEIAEYGSVAKDVFKNGWGESIEDVTDAIGTVTQMMGDMDAANLQAITENAMTLSDVFGWDVTDSVRSVNSMMDQFGISSDEAFNLMAQGAQMGLDQNGDLLDVLNEYSVQFADAGFSADEMFNMLKNGAEEGVWSVDKLGDAVKEYNIRMSDGTASEALMENYKALGLTRKEAEELSKAYGAGGEAGTAAMKSTLEAIMSVEDENERYKLGVEMFGTMWEDLGEDAVNALFETEGAINSTNDAMSQVKTDAYDNLASSLSILGRTLKDELLTPLVETVGPVVKEIVNWIIENMDIVKPIIIGVATAFGVLAAALSISGIISGVSKAMAVLNTTLLANPIVLIVAAIAGLVAAFISLWNNCDAFREFWINLWEIIKNAAATAWEAISSFFSTAWETIKAVWDTVQPYFSAIWETIKAVFAVVVEYFSTLFSDAWAGIQTAWAAVSEWFSGLWESIKNIFFICVEWFSQLFTNAWTGIQTAWAAVTTWFATLWANIQLVFQNCVAWFTQIFTDAWAGAQAIWDTVSGYFSTLWANIQAAFADTVTWFSKLFSDAWAAITAIWDLVVQYFTDLWENIKLAFADTVEWWSTLFSDAWKAITAVWDTVSTYFSDLWDNITGTFSTIGTTLEGYFNNAWDLITGVFAGWGEFFSGLWESITSTFSNIGTNLSTAIGDSVTSGINSILGWVESTVNSAIGLINGAIDIINKVPGVDVSHVKAVSIPKLASGGVAREPMLAEIGEYAGASRNPEIVTPQDILRDTFEESLARFAENGFNSDSGQDIKLLNMSITELFDLIAEYLPGIAKNSNKGIYIDKRRLVGELAPDIDDALGEIADRKGRGAV